MAANRRFSEPFAAIGRSYRHPSQITFEKRCSPPPLR